MTGGELRLLEETLSDLTSLRETTLKEAEVLTSTEEAQLLFSRSIGKKGYVDRFLQILPKLTPDERAVLGKELNRTKELIRERINARRDQLESQSAGTFQELDITVPGVMPRIGIQHPVSKTFEKICRIFIALGFTIVDGPHIETTHNNFEALNTPRDHPAWNESDTFFFTKNLILRTHTSPVQIRTMKRMKDDPSSIRIISPGVTFRRDKADRTHTPMFSQVEGLMIGEKITFAHLKGILDLFFKELFGKDVKIRFRPDYFPFVEPGAEPAITCVICRGSGCPVCKGTGWVEVGGCGMVHPNVLRACEIDPKHYQGFAFGMGIERIAMLMYQIDDSRHFFKNDIRFLCQFN